VAPSTIAVMADDGMNQMDPPSPKVVAALLREARSVSRRADKLGADVTAVQDATIQELAAQASSSIDQLVHLSAGGGSAVGSSALVGATARRPRT
jgi:hypothetical protein